MWYQCRLRVHLRIKADPSGASKRSPGISVTLLPSLGGIADDDIEKVFLKVWIVERGKAWMRKEREREVLRK